MKHKGSALDDGRPSAVAIAYGKHDSAPRVVAKGYGTLAETIVRTARENGLYVHESPELVGLLMQVDLDQHIPPELYVAVAELLAWLYSLENRPDRAPGAASRAADNQTRTTNNRPDGLNRRTAAAPAKPGRTPP